MKKAITKGKAKQLHVIADFDRTLTPVFVDGKSIPSLISILRDGNYLTLDYAAKAHALYDKYHPIEIDPEIPLAGKKEAMREWWMAHFDLLAKSGFTRDDLEKVVESGKIRFRDGALQFIDSLYAHKIPLIIMSSAGIGEVISMVLKKEGRLYDNIYIISNVFEWDKNGNAISIREPIIHAMNKDETEIKNLPVFDLIKNRKNVLLLGDNLEDAGMVKGFDYKNLIKIGFLNENVKENLERYKNNFDVVILNDISLDYVNQLLTETIK